MKLLASIAILCSVIIVSQQSSAEMQKLRSWPAAIPVPSAELKKQYEYDPAAGAGSDKLLTVETTHVNSAGSTITKINYVNGMPVSGTGDWSSYVMAYHWFLYISSGAMKTKVINYTDSGSWPSKSVKFLVVMQSDRKNSSFKTTDITECLQGGSFIASSAFPSLPGKVYEYKCVTTSASSLDMNNQTSESGTDPFRSMYYYSDYLDMLLFYKYESPGQWVSYKVEFIGSDGKPHLLSYRNDQIALP